MIYYYLYDTERDEVWLDKGLPKVYLYEWQAQNVANWWNAHNKAVGSLSNWTVIWISYTANAREFLDVDQDL